MSKKSKFILFSLILSFILFYGSSSFALEVQTPQGTPGYPPIPFAPTITQDSKLPDFIAYFFMLGIYLAGVLAVISLVVGGVQFVFSGISPEARNNAIDKIKSAILGLVLLVASVIIIQTINPTLKNLQYTVALKPLGVLQLVGNNKSTPAPENVSDISNIRQDYSAISWPAKQIITDPTTNQQSTVSNCDPNNPNIVYVIYWYNKKGFEDFARLNRLECGGQDNSLGSMGSYIIRKEIPGVYFYDTPACQPSLTSDSSALPQYFTKSVPEWVDTKWGTTKSVRIVNGPDLKNGPFFGTVLFNDQDYKTNKTPRIFYIDSDTNLPASENYSRCIDTSTMLIKSAVIYKWAGLKDNSNEPNINCSVDLYSKNNWAGGYYTISTQSEGVTTQYWLRELKKIIVNYPPGTSIPVEEQQQCDNFYPEERCLQSFEIKGNCLVIVADDQAVNSQVINSYAQAFPISSRLIDAYANKPSGYSRERGTPELENDYITSGYSYFIKVIPLATKLTE